MDPQKPTRHEVIIAGIGGKGVLVAGQLLARAAMSRHKYVLWFPSYAGQMRGAPCECSVILSDNMIASPLLSFTEGLIVTEPSQLELFVDRVRPGGVIVIESAGSEKIERKDVRVLEVPAVEKALGLGDSQVANLVLLGAYIQATDVLPSELVEKELETRFSGKEKMLALNKRAFQEGMMFASEQNPPQFRRSGS